MLPRIKLATLTGLVVIAALLVTVLPAMPAAAAAPDLAWTALEIPGLAHRQMIVGSGNWTMDVAPDGKTVFAYDNVGLRLYKSTDGGLTWAGSGIGVFYTETAVRFSDAGLPNPTVVAITVSPDYLSDSRVLLADSSYVYQSANGGATFTRLQSPNVGVINSIDFGPYFAGGTAILVGGSLGAAILAPFNFVAVDFDPTAAGVQGTNVLAVALPPNHLVSNEISFVTTDGEGVYLRSKYGDHAVDADQMPALITSTFYYEVSASSRATLAFPADYGASAYRIMFAGLGNKNGATAPAQDVYQVTFGPPVDPSAFRASGLIDPQAVGDIAEVADLNVKGAGTSTNVYSLSFKGNMVDGSLYIGQQDSTAIYRSLGNNPGFGLAQPFSGTTNTIVVASPDASSDSVYAISSGPGSSFAVSPDNGGHFFDMSLISVATADLSLADIAVTADTAVYLVLNDTAGKSLLLKSIDTGATWQNIAGPLMTNLTGVFPSPSYAIDGTVFVTANGGQGWKVTDGGLSASPFTSPGSASTECLLPLDGTDYFLGTNAGIYRKGSSTPGAGTAGTITSIARVDAGNLFVGTSTGQVFYSTNDGASFIEVKPGIPPFTSGDVYVVTDVNYSTNRIIFAAGAQGIKRINADPGAGTTWTTIFNGSVKGLTRGAGGTLYAASANSDSVYRIVDPTSSTPVVEDLNSPSIPGWPSGTTSTTRVQVVPSAGAQGPVNTLYAVADTPNEDSVLIFRDTLTTAPTLLSPANNARGRGIISWSVVPSAPVTYRYQVAGDSEFFDLIVNSTTVTPNATLSGLTEGSKYYWRVSVEQGSPLASPKSAVRSFTFTTAPQARGDANDDGVINMGDVTRTELVILGMAEMTPGADANGDGSVTMGDVTRIELMILGLA